MLYHNDILFIHIPKTGGTSLVGSVINHLGINSNLPKKDSDLLLSGLNVGKHGCLWAVRETAPQIGLDFEAISRVIVLFRNPYDRLISHYYFSRKTAADYEEERKRAGIDWRETGKDWKKLDAEWAEKNIRVPLFSWWWVEETATRTFIGWLKWLLDNPVHCDVHRYENYILLDGKMPENLEIFFFEDIPRSYHKMLGAFGITGEAGHEFPHAMPTPHPPWMSQYDAESEELAYQISRWTFDNGYYERMVF